MRPHRPPPKRKHPVHYPVVQRDDRPAIVLVTVCTEKRKAILATCSAAATIVSAWKESRAWKVGRYVVMPDHVHFFCSPVGDIPLGQWIKFWKSLASRRWPRPSDQPVWQQDYWDTQLRRGESYEAKWEYVRQNPVRHGLVTSAGEWPYAGELNVLEWPPR